MSHYKIPDHYWNILTQAIGIESELSPSVKSVRLAPSDKLLMCTDGLYRMLSCQEISSLIKQNAANVNTIVENLVNKAIEHGGEDNISVILIQHD